MTSLLEMRQVRAENPAERERKKRITYLDTLLSLDVLSAEISIPGKDVDSVSFFALGEFFFFLFVPL